MYRLFYVNIVHTFSIIRKIYYVGIESISIWYLLVTSGSTVLLLISLISILYCHDLLDQLHCCRYPNRYHFVIVWSAVLLSISSISIRYQYDIVSWLLDQLYCCPYRRYGYDIDTISSCSCWMYCIAVDIVNIDTDTARSYWISCIAADIIDIDMIASCSFWIYCIAATVDIHTIWSCDIG